jgi:hypothetical protein
MDRKERGWNSSGNFEGEIQMVLREETVAGEHNPSLKQVESGTEISRLSRSAERLGHES